jgi:hypothetical protein
MSHEGVTPHARHVQDLCRLVGCTCENVNYSIANARNFLHTLPEFVLILNGFSAFAISTTPYYFVGSRVVRTSF